MLDFVIPQARGRVTRSERGPQTVSEVSQVDQLVAPLCDYPQSIFDEGDDDEEAADHGQVTVEHQIISISPT